MSLRNIKESGPPLVAAVLLETSLIPSAKGLGLKRVYATAAAGTAQIELAQAIPPGACVWCTGLVVDGGTAISARVTQNSSTLFTVETRDASGPVKGTVLLEFSYAPLGSDAPVTLLTPLDIFGADLLGWWNADNVIQSGGKVSQMTDLSGNNRHLVQASGPLQPGFTAAGPNGKPAIVFDGTGTTTGTAKRLTYSGTTGASSGDFPSLHVVQKMDTVNCANLCNTLALLDSVSPSYLLLDRRNTIAPGYFGGIAALAGASGGFNGPATLDTAAHLQQLILSALKANVWVDGVVGADKTTTGGLAHTPDTIDLGGSSLLTGNTAFAGQIPEALLVKVAPSATQSAQLYAYIAQKYLIAFP